MYDEFSKFVLHYSQRSKHSDQHAFYIAGTASWNGLTFYPC